MTNITEVYNLLIKECKLNDSALGESRVYPTHYTKNKVILNFNGWSIVLRDNDTWYWEDTTGG